MNRGHSKTALIAVLSIPLCFMLTVAQQRRGGVTTGEAQPPIFDSKMRPITAGGFVDDAPVVFEDITSSTGLHQFHHRSGTREKKYILEVPSGGVALFDYDNDGWLDIYLVNGSTFEALAGKEPAPRAALFHNNRDGTFTDVTAKAGVANERWGFGAVAGDFDNDGNLDLYVTNFGPNRLYRNNGDGTFTDIAVQAGVTVGGWSTAASFGDYNRDGKLDLFVCRYLEFDPKNPPNPPRIPGGLDFCSYRGQPIMCGPRGLKGQDDKLFLNKGNGKFEEVSASAGVADKQGYYGFAAVWIDMDDDGWVDLLVANDSTPNYFYRNKRDGTFEDISYRSGFAFNEHGREQASMGIAAGDYNNDGRVDLYVTNFSDDYNTLYRNEGDNFLVDVSYQLGLARPTIPFLGWGTGFLDYDSDGFLDLFVANGHVYPEVDRQNWGTTWAQRPLLFRNLNGVRFEPVPPKAGSGLAIVVPARGAAFGDLDNDGRVDVVLNNHDSTPTVLRNVWHSSNHWVALKLVGANGSPRDAIGARVYVTAGGNRQRRDVISGGSYASHSDMKLYFGLGASNRVEKVEVYWPSGRHDTIESLPVDKIVTLVEGNSPMVQK